MLEHTTYTTRYRPWRTGEVVETHHRAVAAVGTLMEVQPHPTTAYVLVLKIDTGDEVIDVATMRIDAAWHIGEQIEILATEPWPGQDELRARLVSGPGVTLPVEFDTRGRPFEQPPAVA